MHDSAALPPRPGSGRGAAAAWLGGLPRRDLLLLPLLALATLLALVAISEVGARIYAPAREKLSCVEVDRRLGFGHGRPMCREEGKIPEGPPVVYAYNACGYRSAAPCGPKPAGSRRIAIMGASFAEGYVVPYEQSFGARAEQALSRACGRPVEVQNLAALGTNLVGVYHELPEALALKPDLIVVAVLPYDLEEGLPPDQVRDRDHPAAPVEQPAARRSLLSVLAALSKESRALTMARHFLFADRGLYLRTYLMSGDTADFLRVPFSPAWERRLADLDTLLGAMAAKAKAAGVPLAILLGPQRAQTVLMTETAQPPPGVDPYALPRRLRLIAAKNGVMMIDATEPFAHLQAPEKLIYTVDGHPSGGADAVIAGAMLHQLTADRGSPFAACQAGLAARSGPGGD